MQFDETTKQQIGLEHKKYVILQEPIQNSTLPENTEIKTNLPESSSENEPAVNIKAKGIKTIIAYPKDDYIFVFTDESSDETLENGGASVYFIIPQGKRTEQFKVDADKISSHLTCQLLAIQKALNKYINFQETEKAKDLVIASDSKAALQAIQKGDSGLVLNVHNALHKLHSLNIKCIMQWVLAHVRIDENATADTLAKEARKLNNDKLPSVVTLKILMLWQSQN